MTLIEQLEAAPEGSRELDELYARELGWTQGKDRGETHIERHYWYTPAMERFGLTVPPWTTSIDAALTQVPGRVDPSC